MGSRRKEFDELVGQRRSIIFFFVIYLHISSVLGMVKPFSAYELFSLPCSITSCQETVVRLMGQEAVAMAAGTQKIKYFLVNFRDTGYFYIC